MFGASPSPPAHAHREVARTRQFTARTTTTQAEPSFSNCLRDNRHGHVKCGKVTRDLRPRQLFPHSPMPVAGGAGGDAAGTSAGASSAAASAAARPLLAAKTDDKKAGSVGAAGKMSAAEKRMLEISAGGGDGGGKGVCVCACMLCAVCVGGRMGICRNVSLSFSPPFFPILSPSRSLFVSWE